MGLESLTFTIVSGSHRKGSESTRIGRYFLDRLKLRDHQGVDFISLEETELPLWSGDIPPHWLGISLTLQKSDALVIVVPEWNGMVPPGIMNFLTYCGAKEVGHKPLLLAGISSGIGGTYCISELRAYGHKNNRLCVIPEHLIIRSCTEVLKEPEPTDPRDKQIRTRIEYSLSILEAYARALKTVRNSGVINYQDFPFGM